MVKEMKFTWETGYTNIPDLTGIEYFSNLTSLDCIYSKTQNLDVSRNTELISLDCSFCYLSRVDVRNNRKLQFLNCEWCHQVRFLDLRNNTVLQELSCGETSICYFEYANNTALKKLRFHYLPLRVHTLDLSNNTELEELYIGGSNITELDFSNNTKIKKVTLMRGVKVTGLPQGVKVEDFEP